MVDAHTRTWVKALSWKLIGLMMLTLVAFAITGSLKEMTAIAVIYHLIQLFLYAVHEKIWNYVAWGKSKGLFVQMTGLSGAGKSTLAQEVAAKLRRKGYLVEIIDGDEYRQGLCSDLGFSKEDRNTNIRRLSFVGSVMARNRVIVLMAAINPYEAIRQEVKKTGKAVKTVYVKCDLDVVKDRDTKGLYARACLPEDDPDYIANFTGISDPFEEPEADLIINTTKETVRDSANKLEKFVLEHV